MDKIDRFVVENKRAFGCTLLGVASLLAAKLLFKTLKMFT